MKKIILLSALALSILAVGGCKKKKQHYPNAKIIKVLPKGYAMPSNKDTVLVIQRQKDLDNILLNGRETPEYLTNIDFVNQTLIIGSRGCHRGVYKLEHSFINKGTHYEYQLTIHFDLTHVASRIVFGIIVEKIPNDRSVKLKVIEINP